MTMERIFGHFKSQDAPTTATYDPADPATYEHYLHAMMADATDYEEFDSSG